VPALYLRGGVKPCPRSTVVETPPALIPLNANTVQLAQRYCA